MLLLLVFFAVLLSCATTAPIPDWAQSPAAITQVYPADAYIAQRGRGQAREAAEAAAAAEIARYFTSRISANSSFRTTTSTQNGVTGESLETETSAFVTSEINLAGIRYAQDAFYNKQAKQWETAAYLDRAEAWALYEPRFKRQADSFRALYVAAETECDRFRKALRWDAAEQYARSAEFEAANTFGQILSPARMNAAFAAVRDEIASIPKELDTARRNAAVYIDCPVDFESAILNAFSRALSSEGFPVARTRAGAAAVCTVTVDEGMQKRELGIFYFPSLQAEFSGTSSGGTSGTLFTYNASAEQAGAVREDVAKYLRDIIGQVPDTKAQQTIAGMFNEINAEVKYEREKSEAQFKAELAAQVQALKQGPQSVSAQREAYRSGDPAKIAAAGTTAADTDHIAALILIAAGAPTDGAGL
ncbi:hypothetical protein FACS1894137_05590 [Spirochaetia bacterium]|nr:hypothetical protein FACS1894137_05590 [Spirochaetia bacterium]